jgi:shikimate kinase
MRISLIGMPASGKSTIGKKMAKELGYSFIDLDDLIVEQENVNIPEIFTHQGEDYFRKAEQKALFTALEQPKVVIATGGGTPCFFENMEYINAHSLSIWINLSIPALVDRLLKNQHRPLYQLPEDELCQKIEETYQKRVFFYQKAKLVLDI